MRKLTRLDLQALAETMPVLSLKEQSMYMGMYSNDCFWRCVAYVKSSGHDYSEAAAESYALSHYISKYNVDAATADNVLNNNSAAVTVEEGLNYLQADSSFDHWRHRFYHISDPSKIAHYGSGSSVPGTGHTVLYMNCEKGVYTLADPQTGQRFTATEQEIIAAGVYSYEGRPGSNNQGGGSSSGDDGGSGNTGSSSSGEGNYSSDDGGSGNEGSSSSDDNGCSDSSGDDPCCSGHSSGY